MQNILCLTLNIVAVLYLTTFIILFIDGRDCSETIIVAPTFCQNLPWLAMSFEYFL